MAVKFGVRLPPCDTIEKIADVATLSEKNDFDYVWAGDSHLIWRDVFMTLTSCALKTKRVKIGPNVTNPVTRHPMAIASAIATLDELSGGRAVLGMGRGGSSVTMWGLKPCSVSALEESIRTIDLLLEGKFVKTNGNEVKLRGATGRRIPTYVAAGGPKVLQTAGKIADGVIIHQGTRPELLNWFTQQIRIGCEKTGRDYADIDVVLQTFCCITEDIDAGREKAKPLCVDLLQNHPDWFERTSMKDMIDEFRKKNFPNVYPKWTKAEDWTQAIKRADFLTPEIVKAICDEFFVIGTPEDCIRRLSEIVKIGINHFYIRDFFSYSLPIETVKVFGEKIIPAFRY